jgi:hypothetical protein
MSIQRSPWPFSECSIVLIVRLVTDPISTTIAYRDPVPSCTVCDGHTCTNERRVLAVPRQ